MKKLSLMLVMFLLPLVCYSQTQIGGGGSSGSSGATIANNQSIIASGLVQDLRFLAGTGTTATDSSGSGNNATFCASTQAPSWLSPGPGVRFTTYTANQCIQEPTALNTVLGASTGATIQFLFYYDSNDGSTLNYINQYYCLLCSNGNGLTKNAGGIILENLMGNGSLHDVAYDVNGLSTNTGGSSGPAYSDTQTTWQGTGVLTYVSNPTGSDLIYINGRLMGTGNVTGGFMFAQNAPFAGNFFLGYPATGFVQAVKGPAWNLYRLSIWNRILSPAEIYTSAQTVNYFAGQTSVLPTMPCCMGTLAGGTSVNSDQNDQLVSFWDSIGYQNATDWMDKLVLNGSGVWTYVNSSQGGNTAANFVASSPYSEDPLLRPFGGKNAMVFCYGNDLVAGTTPYADYKQMLMIGTRALSAGWNPPGFCTLTTRTTSSYDTERDTFNSLMRTSCPNFIWCPILYDLSTDYNIGVDGGASNATYFADGVHLTPTGLYNNVSIIVERQTNRWFGNKTFASANTYTSSGTNTNATTSASETGNVATVNAAAITPCAPGMEAFVTGMLPAGYNTPAGQDGWFIRSTTTTSITFYDFNTGLGAQTQAGTIHCAQQLDADDHLILAGVGAQTFYMESCVGQNQPEYFMVTDTTAWTLTPWSSGQTINGGATFTSPVGSATNAPVVELDPIPLASSTAGCKWQAHLQ